MTGASATTESYRVTGLRNGRTYSFKIRAVNNVGYGVVSDAVTVTPMASAIVLSATPGDGRVRLDWTYADPEFFLSWVYLQKKGAGGGSGSMYDIPGGKTKRTHTVTGLTNGTAYSFQVGRTTTPPPGVPTAILAPMSNEVTATPNPPAGVTISPSSLTVEEGSSNTYTVKLNRRPSASVTVTVGGASGDVTVAGSPLTFTTSNWDTAQTITVNAGTDADAEDDTATLTHSSASSDADYGNELGIDDVDVTVTDTTPVLQLLNDPAAVTEGTAISLTVTSDKALTGDLKVRLRLAARSSNGFTAADIRGSLGPRNFTASFGSTASTTGTVTIPTILDSTVEGAEAYRITLRNGTGYVRGADRTADGTLKNVPTSLSIGDVTAAEGGTFTFTVTASPAPSSEASFKYTVTAESGDTATAGTDFTAVTPATAATVAANAGSATVTVSVTNDDLDENNETFTVTLSDASAGTTITDATATGTIEDDDESPVLSGIANRTVKAGQAVDITAVATDGDNDPITYAWTRKAGETAPAIPGGTALNQARLMFTTTTVGTYTMEVTASDGNGNSDTEEIVIRVTATSQAPTASGGGGGGGGSGGGSTTPTGTKGVTVSRATLRVSEGGGAVYTVVLDRRPSGNVTITVSGASGDVTVSPSSLTFTPANWDTPQTVTVRAAEDADAVADTATLTHEASGGGYGSVSIADVSVRVTENDEAGVAVTPTELMVDEGGSGTYTVALTSEPTAEVTVAIAGAAGDITVAPASRGFTAANWDTAQTVTVRAAEDADAVADTATLTHEVSGGDYDSVKADAVSVRVTDNDKAGVTVTPTELTVDEDGSGTYTVVLTSEPTGPVTVTPASSDGGAATVSEALSFTAANWDTPQTVTVSGVEDEDSLADMRATVSHRVSGGDYGGVTAESVSVTVRNTTSAEALGRANRLNEVILPQFAAGFATQTLGAVADRIESVSAGFASRELRLGAMPMSASSEGVLNLRHDGRTGALGDRTGFGGRTDRPLRLADVLDGAAFGMTLGQEEEEGGFPAIGVWGRGGRLSLSGTDREVSWDGGLWSAHVGADARIGSDFLAGIVVSHATGDFDASGAAETGSVAGIYEAGLTSAHPYLAWLAPDGSNLWASGGYGRGEVRVTETGMNKRDAGMSFASGAVGGRSVLFRDADLLAGGMTRLAVKGEGSYARFSTASESGLEGLTAHTSRLRLMLEGSHERTLGTGTLTPALEVGVLYDRGDAVEGAGVEVGGSVAYRMRDPGLTLQVRSRALVTHAETERREWGVGAMVSLDPGDEGRGPFLKVAPSQGGTESGLQQMFDRTPAFSPTPMAGLRAERRLTAEGGHGFGLPLAGVLTPYAGLQMAEMGRALRLGARYQLGPLFRLDLEGARRESVMGTRDRRLALQGALGW